MYSIGGVLSAVDPARRHTGLSKKQKKFEQRVKKMSISPNRCRENLNNDCLQKIMGTTVYMGFHLFVVLHVFR